MTIRAMAAEGPFGMPAVWLVAAAVAALALVAIAVLLWRRRTPATPIDTAEEAAQAAAAALAGFDAYSAVVAANGSAALALAREGRVAVVKRAGRRLAVREVPWTAVRATPGGLLVETGDRRFGAVALAGVDALDVRRMRP